jgi:hypothetical protein
MRPLQYPSDRRKTNREVTFIIQEVSHLVTISKRFLNKKFSLRLTSISTQQHAMKRGNERYICIGLSCHTWTALSHKLWSLGILPNCKILLHTLDWRDGAIAGAAIFFWLIGIRNMAVMESFRVSVRPLPMINDTNFEIKYTERCLYPFSTKIGKSAFFDAKKSENCKLNWSASTYERHNNNDFF